MKIELNRITPVDSLIRKNYARCPDDFAKCFSTYRGTSHSNLFYIKGNIEDVIKYNEYGKTYHSAHYEELLSIFRKVKLVLRSMKFLLFFFILISFSAYSQNSDYKLRYDIPKVIPPSPNASSLGKYGDIPVGLYSGIPNVSIPLYTVNLGEYSLPISASYHSQGLKVEEKSGDIGLNWSLNAGGVITRTVRGHADESATGYWYFGSLTNEYISSDLANGQIFCKGEIDAQPDLFYFNFNGYSGKFVIDNTPNHIVHLIPAQPALKIRTVFNTLGLSFEVTDERGIKYIFDVPETTMDDNDSDHPKAYFSAWYPSKIRTTSGDISFSYATNNTYFSQYYEIQHIESENSPDAHFYSPGFLTGLNHFDIVGRVLTGITTPLESLQFSTTEDRKDMPSAKRITTLSIKDYASKPLKKIEFIHSYFGNSSSSIPEDCRLKLDKIIEYASDNLTGKQYTFMYNSPGNVPSVKSLSQDFWGYSNGKLNTTLLPYLDPKNYGTRLSGMATPSANREADFNYSVVGTLSQIVFPTGGTTDFIYQSNDYGYVNGSSVNEDQQTAMRAQSSAQYVNTPVSNTQHFLIDKTQTVNVNIHGRYSSIPLENGPAVFINRLNTNGSKTNLLTIYMINQTESRTLYLSEGNYELVTSVDGISQNIVGSVDYYNMSGVIKTKKAGGIRIWKIVTTDPVTQKSTQKEYNYESDIDSTRSSGVLVSDIKITDIKVGQSYSWTIRSSSSQNYLGTTQGCFVGYGRVVEKENDLGRRESYFTTASTFPNTFAAIYFINNITSNYAPSDLYRYRYLNDYDVLRGYLTSELIYNSSNKLVKKTVSQYNLTQGLDPTSANYFELNSKSGLYYRFCERTCDQCPNALEHSSPICPSIDRLYLIDTKIICPWIYKKMSQEILYDVQGLNPVTMTNNYFYENSLHGKATRIEITDSKGNLKKYTCKYPQDKNLVNELDVETSLALDSMVVKNILNPIETEEYTNGVLTSRIRHNYKIWDAEGRIVKPKSLQTYNLNRNNFDTRVEFQKYDKNGNIIEMKKAEMALNSYKWGYKNCYATLQSLNATSAELYYESFEEITASGIIAGLGHTGDFYSINTLISWVKPNNRYYTIDFWYRSEGVWKYKVESYAGSSYTLSGGDAYDDIRIYPTDAQVTTYTYRPLVGMTSMIDPRGQTTHYGYDGFQRLKSIKDTNENMLKSYDYHYKP